jgi:hypothetical protein
MMRGLLKLLRQKPHYIVFVILYSPRLLYVLARRHWFGPRYDDEQFGRFLLDSDRFDATVQWNGWEAVLFVPAIENKPLTRALERARDLWKDQSGWHSRLTDHVIQENLSLKNSNWLKKNENELTAEEFRARMIIDCISIDDDGLVEFWYHDGGLFWGHSIVVHVEADDKISWVEIAG